MRTISHLMAGTLLGLVLVAGATAPTLAQKNPTTASTTTIDFGDDSSEWSMDGECDDPRFEGTGVADEVVDADLMKDATDCKAAVEAGTATLKEGASNTPAVATATTNIDFGNDTSEWAKDGECDDPRFTGTGAADEMADIDLLKDATDCKAAFEAGTVTLKDGGSTPTTTTAVADIDFGDDSSEWAKDGECDDPRFTGTGSATELVDADLMKDATDCRAAFEAGTVTLKDGGSTPTATTAVANIDFGDDSSEWAKDGECDDPRFTGTGSAAELVDADLMKDATDCRAAFEAGTVTLKDGGSTTTATTVADIDFGDDSSEWAKDGECDDPRFTGTGSATELVDADLMKDATDCKAAFEAGTVTLKDGGSTTPVGDIDYGNDTSEWAKDGECDDPRFSGSGVAGTTLAEDIKKDATDCRAAVEAGTATYNGEQSASAFDFGSDFSKWANDGECDDLRFEGAGVDKKLLSEDLMGDATDCRALLEEGKISIRLVYTPEYAAGAPYDSSGIDFGDNTSSYADDDECDDPRFEGPGAATTLLDSDRMADANDCKAAYEAGTIVLVEGQS